MARIRSIKPGFFINEDVAALPFEWRLLFVGLWTQADRDGRLEDRPQRLKAALFPYDDLNIDAGLGALAQAGLIIRYEGNGQRLISIPRWSKHQQPHIREPISELQPPDPGTVLAPVRPVGSGSGNGSGNGILILDPVPPPKASGVRARFDQFWAVYPKKVGKDAALKEWLKRAPDQALTDTVIAAVQDQKSSPSWTKDGGQFIPHPRTWLHGGRWADEVEALTSDVQRRRLGPSYSWECPHVVQCNAPGQCRTMTTLGRPEKAAAS